MTVPLVEDHHDAMSCGYTLTALEKVIKALKAGNLLDAKAIAQSERVLSLDITNSLFMAGCAEDALSDMEWFHKAYEHEFWEWATRENYGPVMGKYAGSAIS